MARVPKIENLEIGEDRISFVLSNTDTSVANALRKAMMSEVKQIDFFEFLII